MIFAAGLGTRLRPLTDTIPKALIEVGGVPMLERVALRLIEAGATRLIVNAHHHAGRIHEFVRERNWFGIETIISDESEMLLDTGGGLKFASRHFHRDAPFLLYNADVLSDFDLREFYREQSEKGALATLATMERPGSRYLLFDSAGLCGYGNSDRGLVVEARPVTGDLLRLGFCGVHVISPRIFELIEEEGVFSIITLYMRLVSQGERIEPFRIDGSLWIDIGKPESLEYARSLDRL